jgi:hypothetical protein
MTSGYGMTLGFGLVILNGINSVTFFTFSSSYEIEA